jgi:hypothetical protein
LFAASPFHGVKNGKDAGMKSNTVAIAVVNKNNLSYKNRFFERTPQTGFPKIRSVSLINST